MSQDALGALSGGSGRGDEYLVQRLGQGEVVHEGEATLQAVETPGILLSATAEL